MGLLFLRYDFSFPLRIAERGPLIISWLTMALTIWRCVKKRYFGQVEKYQDYRSGLSGQYILLWGIENMRGREPFLDGR